MKSIYQDPKEYDWYFSSDGAYEPIQTLVAIAPMNLIKLVGYNYARDCTTRQCYCKNNNVKYIAACLTCHRKQYRNNDDENIINDG